MKTKLVLVGVLVSFVLFVGVWNANKRDTSQPCRGRILDARGAVLAYSVARKTVAVDPALLNSPDLPDAVLPAVARKIAEVLAMDEHAVRERFRGNSRYAVVRHQVEVDVFQRLTNEISHLDFGLDEKRLTPRQAAKLAQVRQRAVFGEDSFLRVYPRASLGSHVLGYVNNEHKGVSGIEHQFDSVLSPRHKKTPQNRRPAGGADVQLTIDSQIQQIVEEELAQVMELRQADSAVGIVLQPRTGAVLGMASQPPFDPNTPGKVLATTNDFCKAIGLLRNRCIADVAEPGGVLCIVPIAATLNERLATAAELFDSQSPFVYAGIPLTDTHHHGALSLEQILANSSSIGTAKVALKLDKEQLYDYLRAFGFGQRTGIGLPGETAGILHKPATWTSLSITRIAIGHEVAVTPLQMCAAFIPLANGGTLMKPMIASAILAGNGQIAQRFAPTAVRQVIRPETAKQLTEFLVTATTPGHTGAKAAVPGYQVAGKTGTAQKLEAGLYIRKYFTTFVGFVPAQHPELCILIAVDNPTTPAGEYHASEVAAPVFRAVAERILHYLNIPPEHPDES